MCDFFGIRDRLYCSLVEVELISQDFYTDQRYSWVQLGLEFKSLAGKIEPT